MDNTVELDRLLRECMQAGLSVTFFDEHGLECGCMIEHPVNGTYTGYGNTATEALVMAMLPVGEHD